MKTNLLGVLAVLSLNACGGAEFTVSDDPTSAPAETHPVPTATAAPAPTSSSAPAPSPGMVAPAPTSSSAPPVATTWGYVPPPDAGAPDADSGPAIDPGTGIVIPDHSVDAGTDAASLTPGMALLAVYMGYPLPVITPNVESGGGTYAICGGADQNNPEALAPPASPACLAHTFAELTCQAAMTDSACPPIDIYVMCAVDQACQMGTGCCVSNTLTGPCVHADYGSQCPVGWTATATAL